ncbi:MAG: dihydroorotate dehydrogenase-like protein [bacterium]
MDLSTTYLGLELPHPFMGGASPLTRDLDLVRRLEDAGSAAIVMHSLFEEQIAREPAVARRVIEVRGEPTARSPLPEAHEYALGPEEYLEQVRRIREAVSVPVVASLNGTTPGSWLEYASLLEEAGAHALEMNVYLVATDPKETSLDVEDRVVEIVRGAVEQVDIPVAAKLGPHYSALANFARRLEVAGVKGLVLFNRFHQPDIDVDERDVSPKVTLSDSGELLLRLRWLAILSDRIAASLAVSGGVHETTDAVKAVMAGAHAVQMVSALLRSGPEHLRTVREGVSRWLVERGYESMRALRGSMGLTRCPDPQAFERGHYLRVLQSWRGLV